MKPENRLCLWCQFLDQTVGDNLSEETWDPGIINCTKNHWNIYEEAPLKDVDGELYTKFCIAQTCPDFQLNANLVNIVKD